MTKGRFVFQKPYIPQLDRIEPSDAFNNKLNARLE